VHLGPSEHQSQLAALQGALDDLENVDTDLGVTLGCSRVEVGGV
jgi:hypothetical protein